MLKGKTIVVIGATGGLGWPLSKYLSSQGANLVLVSRGQDKLNELLGEIGPERALAIAADASDLIAMRDRVIPQAMSRFRLIDGVVLSAGSWSRSEVLVNPAEEILAAEAKMRQGMVLPTLVPALAFADHFKDQNHGHIFHISSHVVERAELAGNFAYRLAKQVGSNLMLQLAIRFQGERLSIRTSDLRPGIINTRDTEGVIREAGFDPATEAVQPEVIGEWIAHHLNDSESPLIGSFACKAVLP